MSVDHHRRQSDQMSRRRMSHYVAAIYIYLSPHYGVTHHENAITPTPPQLLLIATDKSSMWHVRETLTHFNQTIMGTSVVRNIMRPTVPSGMSCNEHGTH